MMKRNIALTAIFALLLSFAAPPGLWANPAHAENEETHTYIINDFDIGSGINQFQYYGPWGTSTGMPDNFYNGDEHWSNANDWTHPEDVYFTVRFEGIRIQLYGVKAPNHGIFAVSIDGGEEIEVDAYAPTRSYHQLIYDSGILPDGEHLLKVRATGKKTGTAPDMQIDYAAVTQRLIRVSGIEMDTSKLVLEEGDAVRLTANVLPRNATNKRIIWSSSNEAVARIDEAGRLYALQEGTVTVQAVTEDGGFTAVREAEIRKGSRFLRGAVGTTNMHYVKENLYDDYKRITYEDIVLMSDLSWTGSAWKGDRASVQLVLWTTSRAQENISVRAGDLKDQQGRVISSSQIQASFVRTVKAARGNPSLGRPQEPIPDIIYSSEPVNMDAFSVQPIWVSIDVPRDAAAGRYAGNIEVSSASGEHIEFTLNLEVLDLELPETGDWQFFLDMWQNPYAVARVNGITEDQLWTEAHFEVMRPHYAMLAAAGQKVITATVTYDPWNSQTYDRYDTMVKWIKKADGNFEFDFEIFDKWVQFMMDLGINRQIHAYSMVSWASKIKYYDEASGQEVIETVPTSDPKWTVYWRAFLEAFVPHLEEKGWLDITYMANDERALSDLMQAADLIEDISGGRLKIAAAINYNSLDDPRLDRIHNISIGQQYVQHHSRQLAEAAKRRRELGLVTTIYNCVGHYPNSFTRSNPAEPVWVIWNTMRHETDGYLRWAFDSFVEDPFETTDFRTWESGDTAQVYPGAISSVRFEKLKEGIRDAVKVKYISDRDPELGAEIAEEIWKMQAPGYALDPYGGVKDPGIADIPQEVIRLQTILENAARRLIEKRNGPAGFSVLLEGPETVPSGGTFEVRLGWRNVEHPVQAQDITVRYDDDRFEFISAEPVLEHVEIVAMSAERKGLVRLIAAGLGADGAIGFDGAFLALAFRAKETSQPVSGSVQTLEAIASDAEGTETKSAVSEGVRIEIVPEIAGTAEDVNGDGKVSVGDLSFAAAHYGKTNESPDWQLAKQADVNRNG